LSSNSKDVYRLGGIAVVLVLLLVVGAIFYQRSEEEQRSATLQRANIDTSVFERPHSHTLGPDDAKVTIVEFLDPECESCRVMHPIVKRILARYRDDVRLVVRYMPLHPNSVYAAGALEAAAEQGLYWEMMETLFLYQPEWGDHHAPKPELIPKYAAEMGLDMVAFDKFIEAGKYRRLVEADRQDGIKLGVRGTPTFFVNQNQLMQLGYDNLLAMIEQELAR